MTDKGVGEKDRLELLWTFIHKHWSVLIVVALGPTLSILLGYLGIGLLIVIWIALLSIPIAVFLIKVYKKRVRDWVSHKEEVRKIRDELETLKNEVSKLREGIIDLKEIRSSRTTENKEREIRFTPISASVIPVSTKKFFIKEFSTNVPNVSIQIEVKTHYRTAFSLFLLPSAIYKKLKVEVIDTFEIAPTKQEDKLSILKENRITGFDDSTFNQEIKTLPHADTWYFVFYVQKRINSDETISLIISGPPLPAKIK